jgi:hypothetical protein
MASVFFKEAWQKEKEKINPLGRQNKRKNLKVADHQIGKSNYARDVVRKAFASGKRISKSGKIYYEYRKNRSDMPDSMI